MKKPQKCLNWKSKTPKPDSYDNNDETGLHSIYEILIYMSFAETLRVVKVK